MSTTHYVKCWPAFYEAIHRGDKTFDVRNDDRSYQAGDRIVFEQFNPKSNEYTADAFGNGRCERLINYVLRGGQFGIEPGYVVLGLKRVET